jgi:hypothetical protein
MLDGGIMKKYIILCLVFLLLLTANCSKSYTRLVVSFGAQPQGGANVNLIMISIVGNLEGGDTPIQTLVQWWWKAAPADTGIVYWGDTWTWRNTVVQELQTGVQAPADTLKLMGYFWFRITWEDEDGTPNELYSDTAYCF